MSLRSLAPWLVRHFDRRSPVRWLEWPAAATHVLQHVPAELTVPPSQGPGWWELQTVADWQSSVHASDTPDMDGPRDMDPAALWAFIEQDCAFTVSAWSRIEIDLHHADGTYISTEPVFLLALRAGQQ
jgi:hypothetical protein